MKNVVLKIGPAAVHMMRKNVFECAKCVAILLIVAIGIAGCDKTFQSGEEHQFCFFDNFDEINKTIPIVNEFLAELPDGTTKEQTFQSLVTWFKSCPCIIDATMIPSDAAIYPPEMAGVSFSVMENGTIIELYLDFAVIDNYVIYSQIAGYHYVKQDAIHVKTKFTKIDNVFDFINSLEFGVKEIQRGTYVSSMQVNTDNLEYIVNNLKAKPYTNDAWVIAHLNWYPGGITLFINLYGMKNLDYQTDWFKSMNDYKLVEYDFEEDSDNIYGPGHIIVFQIPEGTGKHWEAKFMEYDFVRWAEMSYSGCVIR